MHRLVACQCVTVASLMSFLALAPTPAWGAWLPALGFFLGAAVFVWRFAGEGDLTDREQMKALALGAGLRWASLSAVLFLAGTLARPPGGGALEAVAVAGGLWIGLAPTLTMLTLIGLDMGRG